MRRVLTDLKIMLLANLWIVPVLAALIGAVFYFVAPPPSMYATMATGAEGGAYRVFGEKLKVELAKEGFDLKLQPTTGSRENLEKLLEDDPQVQIGLVQSGMEQLLKPQQQNKLLSLGAVYHEPLWLFYRNEVSLDKITDLQHMRVALGSANSGTMAVASAILSANDILPDSYPSEWQTIGGSKAANALLTGEVDAAFFVGPAESPRIQQIASNPDITLANFRRVDAYEARLPFLSGIKVGEGLLNLAQNAPAQNTMTLSPMATLVINEDFNPGLAALFLQAATTVMKNGTLLDKAGELPSADPHTFKLSSDAEHFYKNGLPLLQRYLPFRIASLADRYIILLIPLLVVLFPLFKAVGPLYRWRIRARIYRWYKYLREIDRQLHEGSLPEHLDAEIKRLDALQDELARVEVPLSYSNELYDLHVHLRYVIERLKTLQKRRAKNNEASA
ncbi:C4-dicarboxylate ABC transporter substrate-binding protein [Pseudomonas sp. J237]|nr:MULTISPECIES: TAXI family TRAP transporter solute-binding subunit [Pseudomonas]OEO24715.1 C4-dicarboxylate ABC transporter substrate-binding protein [Pseudomonas sp. J237]